MRNRSVLDWPTGLTVHKPESCFEGFTLFNAGENAYLIDMKGEICHMWAGTTPDMKYLPGGHLLTGLGGRSAVSLTANFTWAACASSVGELNWEGDIAWEYKLEHGVELHHDLARLPNGNTLMLLRKWVEAPPQWGEYRPYKNLWFVIPCDEDLEKPVLNDFVREVNPAGEVVWEWHTIDHVDEFGWTGDEREKVRNNAGDWLHTNTAEILPDGDLLVSFPKANRIAIVDRKTGGFRWMWGHQENGLIGQHHPNMIPAGYHGEGNILVFDNGGDKGYIPHKRHYTRLLEIDPSTGNIVWQYVHLPKNWVRTHRNSSTMLHHMHRFFSPAWGSVQRLPNGNTMTLDSAGGRLFEITTDGNIVWEYVSPHVWSAVLPTQQGGVMEDAGLDPELKSMPGVPFYFKGNDLAPVPADRMASFCTFVYRCCRLPYKDAPKASHG